LIKSTKTHHQILANPCVLVEDGGVALFIITIIIMNACGRACFCQQVLLINNDLAFDIVNKLHIKLTFNPDIHICMHAVTLYIHTHVCVTIINY